MPNPWDAVLNDPQRSVSRQEKDSDTHSALNPGVDTRVIVVAQGIQFNNAYFDSQIEQCEAQGSTDDANSFRGRKSPHALKDTFGDDLIMLDDASASYWSEAQQVQYYIYVVSTKDQFMAALATPGLHVIYSGHARYGQGPCFGGADDGPGENWGNGTDPATTGIYRMGFPLVGIEIKEILQAGYSIYPVFSDGNKLLSADCHPEIPRGSLHQWSVDELTLSPSNGTVHTFDPAILAPLLKPAPADDSKFWGYDKTENGELLRHIVVNADWQNTQGGFDLGVTDLQCRVFCHFGCSTFTHNYPIMRRRKQWQRDGDDRFAYWTRRPSYCPYTTNAWLRSILGYPKVTNNGPWEPSIKWAVQKANAYLNSIGKGCGIV
jgi:hypothetical protein